jgi:hypothetical protein
MIHYELLSDQSILLVTPEGALDSADFEKLAGEIDPIIEKKGGLSGMMIYVKSFPGWKDFAAFLAHLNSSKIITAKLKKSPRSLTQASSPFCQVSRIISFKPK